MVERWVGVQIWPRSCDSTKVTAVIQVVESVFTAALGHTTNDFQVHGLCQAETSVEPITVAFSLS